MTTLNGTLTTCGPGQYFSLQFTCNGPSCAGLSGFPNTTCTTDATNTIFTCSNGVTCPGPTNYTANFNLSQTTDLVTQSQQILLPDFCEEIDVTSDGTTGGVNAQRIITGSCGPPIGNITLPSGNSTSSSTVTAESVETVTATTCPESGSNSASTQSAAAGPATASTKPSSAAAGNAPSNATTTSSTASTPAGAQTSAVVFTGGSSSIRNHISLSPFKLISFILCFLFFIQGTAAFSPRSVPDIDMSPANAALEIKPSSNVTSLELFKRELTPGWKQFADLFAEWLAGKISTPKLADNLVDELAEAVCDHAVGVVITKALGVDLVEACVTAIDVAGGLAALGTLQPEIEFAAVLGSGVLCNLLVSEALPGIGQLTDAICSQEKPCSEDLLTDVNNCGRCDNVCATGESCVNGACTSSSCTGQTCSTFGPCGPGGSCVCASTTEGTGYCVDGNTPCDGLATCDTSLGCASGEICAVATCCDINVCVGATFCGGSNAADLTTRDVLFMKRKWVNNTIAMQGSWVD